MSPVLRMTAYAASMRRRTSSAYAARRSSSARATRVSATGVRTSFWIPRMVFRNDRPVDSGLAYARPVLHDVRYHERDPQRTKAYEAAGYWTDDTLGSMLQ